MEESKKLKDKMRKEKYLNKMKNQNKDNIKNNNKIPLINNLTPYPQNESSIQETTETKKIKLFPKNNSNNINNNINNHIYDDTNTGHSIFNNNIFNEETSTRINYIDTLKQANKYKYIIDIFNLIKKIVIMFLTLFHCFCFFNLDNSNTFLYSLFFIEISSLLINKYYNTRTKNLIKDNKIIVKYNDNKNEDDKHTGFNYLVDILYRLVKQSGPLTYIISFFIVLIDILVDISIIFFINIIFFIIHEEDD